MTAEPSPRVPSGAPELRQLLHQAKVSVPEPRQGSVSRAALIHAARSSSHRVVGITAPAGYGKTTLLAEWAQLEDRPVAWTSLDYLDDDPAVLLASLAAAYGGSGLGSPDLVADVMGRGASALSRAAPRLASEIRSATVPFMMMLDDLHVVQSPTCHDVLSLVISAIPPGSQLAIASRSEQPHLPRLRVVGDALEFGPDDLALDVAGAGQVFSQADVSVTTEEAASATERTEGWPAGIYLAALMMKDVRSETPSISGDDRFVADYLYQEVHRQLTVSDQEFLRRTSVLDQICGPLCEALLGSSGALTQLRRLEAQNLFLTPLDRERNWYRYHALYREFLQGELRQTEPDIISVLHRRAAQWYEANGFPAFALEHLLRAQDWERSAYLIGQLAQPTFMTGQLSTVQRWFSQLGDANIQKYPPVAVLAAWEAVLTGDTVRAEQWAVTISAASFEAELPTGAASFESSRALLRAAMCANGPEQMLADLDFALGRESAWSPWRDTALWLQGEAHLLANHPDEARSFFADASTTAVRMQSWDTIPICESQLAWLAMDRGDWNEATDRLSLALNTIDTQRLHDYVFSIPTFAGEAKRSLHEGRVDEARRRLTQAMRSRPSATYVLPYHAVRLRLQLAKVYLALSDSTSARQLLLEVDEVIRRRPHLGTLIDEVNDFRNLLTSDAVDGSGPFPLTPAELRLLPYMQTHLTFSEIGARLYVSRNTVSSQAASIYRKLGVSSRGEAVERATTTGLLSG